MVDIVDPGTRSRMMSAIKAKDTSPELILRHALHKRGFRYRLHDKRLPGRPDIILQRHRAVIFVHGCFWHRHEGCRYASTPSTRPEFWQEKFKSNSERDERTVAALGDRNLRVAIVWECRLRSKDISEVTETIAEWLRHETSATLVIG